MVHHLLMDIPLLSFHNSFKRDTLVKSKELFTKTLAYLLALSGFSSECLCVYHSFERHLFV